MSPVATPWSMMSALSLGRNSVAIDWASWKTTTPTSSDRYGFTDSTRSFHSNGVPPVLPRQPYAGHKTFPHTAYAVAMATAEALEIPLAINVAAVFVGALGGAVRAGEDEHVDVVGVLTLAAVMGFGGGIIRDVLLGNLPPAVLRHPSYVIAALTAAAIGAFFVYYLRKLGKVLWVLDSLSVGMFACVGVNAALLAGLSVLPATLIGTVASVGGLILTDIFQGRPSSILHVGPPNALAGLCGAFA